MPELQYVTVASLRSSRWWGPSIVSGDVPAGRLRGARRRMSDRSRLSEPVPPGHVQRHGVGGSTMSTCSTSGHRRWRELAVDDLWSCRARLSRVSRRCRHRGRGRGPSVEFHDVCGRRPPSGEGLLLPELGRRGCRRPVSRRAFPDGRGSHGRGSGARVPPSVAGVRRVVPHGRRSRWSGRLGGQEEAPRIRRIRHRPRNVRGTRLRIDRAGRVSSTITGTSTIR